MPEAVDTDAQYMQFAENAVFAERARVDDCVLFRNESTLSVQRIVNVGIQKGTGIYSPVTDSGTLIVDGVATSVYSSIESHHVQHVFFRYTG